MITGGATFLGGTFHSLPFIIDRLSVALPIAIAVVSVELVMIGVLRRRFLDVTLSRSLIQVTLGGAVVVLVGVVVGQA
jgi:VIT1/CCC1 family predicted Fe2+/Mn2+ transporter